MTSLFGFFTAPAKGQSLLNRYAVEMRRLADRREADLSHLQSLHIKDLDMMMRSIVEANFDGVMTIDHDGHITTSNFAAQQMFGFSDNDILRVQGERILPGFRTFTDPRSEDYCVGQGHRETLGVREDGSGFPIDLCLTETQYGDETLLVAIIRDITEVKEQRRQLEHQALHDSLTGLPNRVLLNDRLSHALHAAERSQESVALLLLDLDNFKEINDTLGHHVGDMVLSEIATRLIGPVRNCDTVARLGGDEFAVLLPIQADIARAQEIALRLRESITRPIEILNGLRLEVDSSIGIAMYPEHAGQPAKLMQCADVAMYVAKDGTSKTVVYDAEMDNSNLRHLTLSGELRKAIENVELTLEFQPKLHLNSQMITSVEALARWYHPQYGPVPPDEFVAQAERTGMIRSLTRWIIETALDQAVQWREKGFNLGVAINLSPRILHDNDMPKLLGSLIAESLIPPESVTLEITETAIVIDPDRAFANAKRMADLGMRLSIDDFGTGYSSLSYMQKMPLSELKIDRSFVINMMHNDSDVVIVRSTIDLAHNLGVDVVAEGIEIAEHLDLLRKLECDYGQGFLISPALKADEFGSWLDNSPWGRQPLIGEKLLRLAPIPPMQRGRIGYSLENKSD